MDLSKAFDTIDHKILLQKLEYYCISGVVWRAILTDQKQYEEINETTSNTLTLTTVVAQGSILGSLYYIIFINDIAHASKLFDVIIYGDDITLSMTLEIALK